MARPAGVSQIASNARLARHIGFWWGLAEGVLFFIVPDVYITFATLYAPRAGAIAWLFSILGSLAAVGVIYVTRLLQLDYSALLDLVPGISASLLDRVGRDVAAQGLPFTPFLVLGGVPLKVYAASAFAAGASLGTVLLWTIFARLARIAPTYALVALVRLLWRRSIDGHQRRWLLLFATAWVAFYIFYFARLG
ncbi:MAG: hypothetical protein ACT4R6_10690 [Gemmatimonadaceae bacterium]